MTTGSFPLAGTPARPSLSGRARRLLLGISPDETRLARRGFVAAGPLARARLEGAGEAFVLGYLAALGDGGAGIRAAARDAEPGNDGGAYPGEAYLGDTPLATCLNAIGRERAGFAFEGAAMALALLDRLTPWRRDRWARFTRGPAASHIYMAHVGAGWAWAKLRKVPVPGRDGLDPLLGWLAVDGCGFCHGYFDARRFADGAPPPRGIAGYSARAFDQGLGRSLWFAHGADPRRAAEAVARFPAERRGDLWSGLGLACAYAGGDAPEAAGALLRLARRDGHAPDLAQGIAFAAKARERAGNPSEATEVVCRRVWGRPAPEVAGVTDRVLRVVATGGRVPVDAVDSVGPVDLATGGAYEAWRQGIMAAYAAECTAVELEGECDI